MRPVTPFMMMPTRFSVLALILDSQRSSPLFRQETPVACLGSEPNNDNHQSGGDCLENREGNRISEPVAQHELRRCSRGGQKAAQLIDRACENTSCAMRSEFIQVRRNYAECPLNPGLHQKGTP